jgi:hypothetical protein
MRTLLMIRIAFAALVLMASSVSAQAVVTKDFLLEIAKGNVSGHEIVKKFGRNPDNDSGEGFEPIWTSGGATYGGFDVTAAEAIEVFSSDAADAGTLVSSGTATGGSATTLVDTAAAFVVDGVSVGDLLINDSDRQHGVVTAVTATSLTVRRMTGVASNSNGEAYRVATAASTGAAVVRLEFLLSAGYVEASPEYVILDGATEVDTTGTYIRHSRSWVVLAGSGAGNAGVITARQTTTTANVFTLISIAYNQSSVCAWTVPAGKSAYVYQWEGAMVDVGGSADVIFELRTRHAGEVFRVISEDGARGGGQSRVSRRFWLPNGPIPPMTDIMLQADSDTDNTIILGRFSLVVTTEGL